MTHFSARSVCPAAPEKVHVHSDECEIHYAPFKRRTTSEALSRNIVHKSHFQYSRHKVPTNVNHAGTDEPLVELILTWA